MGVLFLRAAVESFVRREQTVTEEDVLYLLSHIPHSLAEILVVGL